MDMESLTQGLSVADVEEVATSLETGKDKTKFEDNSRYILLALLGPHLAGPMMADGWFAADFAMAHQIYGSLLGEQTWMCAVDMVQEVVTGGPYYWGYPKHSRLQVLGEGDAPFYSLSSPHSLLSDFKEKLIEIVPRLCAKDNFLVLIFAHGDEEPDENGMRTGILVGEGDQEGFGVLYAAELNSILSTCLARVTLVTSACFGGAWHHNSRTTYSAANDEETLSVPESLSGAYRGGYFWEAMWYELSRLGLREPEKDVEESHKFKESVLRVRERLMDLMRFNPEPAISVASNEEWELHFRKVIHLNEYGDQTHLSFATVPANFDDEGGPSRTGGGSYGGHGNIGGASKVWNRWFSPVLQKSDLSAIRSLGSSDEIILPSYITPRNKGWFTGTMSSHLRHSSVGLPALVDYYVHSMPGLHNLPSNMRTFMLVRKYSKMVATKEELVNLSHMLKYRMIQDVKAEEILSFLNIPRLCSITKFRAEHHQSKGQAPYRRVVEVAHMFDRVPKVSPPCRTYMKPMHYLATTAFRNKIDLVWWRESLEACRDYFEDFEKQFCMSQFNDASTSESFPCRRWRQPEWECCWTRGGS